jgi:hypothetical protein
VNLVEKKYMESGFAKNATNYRVGLVYLAILQITFLLVWGGVNFAQAIPTDVQVSGTWSGRFSGTVEGLGTAQDDALVMELKQKGSKVTGTLRFEGLDLTFPVFGNVTGTTFTYTSKAMLSPNCEATITAETTVDALTRSFKGSQTQKNCEGTAVGVVTAVRRRR